LVEGLPVTGYLAKPDAGIIRVEPQFDPPDKNPPTIINSKVIIKVFPDSTEASDRGAQFRARRNLELMNEIVRVSQSEPQIESFVRQGDRTWLFSAWRGLQAVARLRTVRIDFPFLEVYSSVTLNEIPRWFRPSPRNAKVQSAHCTSAPMRRPLLRGGFSYGNCRDLMLVLEHNIARPIRGQHLRADAVFIEDSAHRMHPADVFCCRALKPAYCSRSSTGLPAPSEPIWLLQVCIEPLSQRA
jgi:hypothetical protein